MGRPIKQTVNYFPHYADKGKTKYILQNRFGNDGYAFWFKLLEMLCNADGHFIDTRNRGTAEFLLAEMQMSEDKIGQILQLLVEIGLLDNELWKSKVIWCQNFVDNLAPIYPKRGSPLPIKPIIDTGNTTIAPIIDTGNNSQPPFSEQKNSIKLDVLSKQEEKEKLRHLTN